MPGDAKEWADEKAMNERADQSPDGSGSGAVVAGGDGPIPPRMRKLHDPNVSFEEYHYYAKLTRREQDQAYHAAKSAGHDGFMGIVRRQFGGKGAAETSLPAAEEQQVDAAVQVNLSDKNRRMTITDEEWNNASRALRTASWGAGFYLITVDILGPYGVGFAIGTLGWAPGIVLYTVFGFMAGWSGYLLCKVYLGLDSNEFPIRNYGDLAYRLFGPVARYSVSILQGIQLIAVLGQVIIQNGQGLSQVSKFRLCYAVCCVLFVLAGFALGQVRTLRNLGWLSTAAVFMNLLVIFVTMGVMAHSEPNYGISVLGSAGSAVDPDTIKPVNGVYPKIIHYNGLPTSDGFIGALNGLMSGVFAYGGAQIFVEIMAEMRRPYDFYKAMWSAQAFIYTVYLVYGCYVYYWQGQYAYEISYQGLSIYGWQVVGDMLALLSGLIAAVSSPCCCSTITSPLAAAAAAAAVPLLHYPSHIVSPLLKPQLTKQTTGPLRQHRHQNLLQQRHDRPLPRPAAHQQGRQNRLRRHRAHLVVRRLLHRRRHPGLLRLRVRRRRHLRRPVLVHLPADSRRRVSAAAPRHGGRRRLRSGDRARHAPRLRVAALHARVRARALVHDYHSRPTRGWCAGYGGVGCVLGHSEHD